MRFPLRLTADSALGLATKSLRGATRHRLILHLAPVERPATSSWTSAEALQTNAADLQLLSSDLCLDAVRQSSAPVVWIGGGEPLLHPEIGRLARRIVDAGRHLFVHTDGALLRRRIHEFRPVSRLFLTVQFEGFDQGHDRRARRDGAFREAVDGIRMAKLSGFLVCAYIVAKADTDLAELEELRRYLEARDVDGFIVMPPSGSPQAASRQEESHLLRRQLQAARAQVRSRRWRLFSQLLESSLPVPQFSRASHQEMGSGGGASDACEESVWVS
jgi:MoaA/NifB/PqqE/SkfB family radical SAM enzyme